MISDLLMIVVMVSYIAIGTSLILDVWFDFKMSGWIKRKIGWVK